jgi:hypothetical protein
MILQLRRYGVIRLSYVLFELSDEMLQLCVITQQMRKQNLMLIEYFVFAHDWWGSPRLLLFQCTVGLCYVNSL